jgi:Protein of unknown function (DUF3309)
MPTALLVVLIVVLLAVLPTWPYSTGWFRAVVWVSSC